MSAEIQTVKDILAAALRAARKHVSWDIIIQLVHDVRSQEPKANQ